MPVTSVGTDGIDAVRILWGWVVDRHFHPYSSAGNTFTFDVVQVTGSNLAPSVSFVATLARTNLNTHLPGSPGR